MYLKECRRRRSNPHGLAKVVMPSGVEASLDISWRHTDEITGSNVERSRLNIPTSKNLPAEGLEPTRSCDHWILSPARLPIPPRRRLGTGAKGYEIRAQAQHPRAGGCAVLSASCLHREDATAEDSEHYNKSSIRKPRGSPRIWRSIIALRKPD